MVGALECIHPPPTRTTKACAPVKPRVVKPRVVKVPKGQRRITEFAVEDE